MFSDNVKLNLRLELKRFFSVEIIDQLVDLYEYVVFFYVGNDNGVAIDIDTGLESFFSQSGNIRQAHKALVNIEPFLKKLLKIIEPDLKVEPLRKNGLAKIMKQLGIIPDSVMSNYATIDPNTISDLMTRAIVHSYQLRNKISHESEAWSFTEMYDNINSIIGTSCYAIWKNKEKVIFSKELSSRNAYNLSSYVMNIVKQYEKEVQDGFRYVPLIWSSFINNKEIEFAPKDIKSKKDKRAALIGEAGCGKTTLINYLEYQDARNYLNGTSKILPIKISLIDENYKYQEIEEMICNKLLIPFDYYKELMSKGEVNLYLDGLNEIIANTETKKRIAISIEKVCETYPNVMVIVTDRPYTIVKVDFETIFHIKKLSEDDVKRYARAQTTFSPDFETKIDQLLEMPAFKDFDYTPIFINQLLEIISRGADLPKDENELIDVYIRSLFSREYDEKKDHNAAPGNLDLLLSELSSMENIESGVSYSKVLRFFSKKISEYGLNIKASECLNLALQMKILKRQGDIVQFYCNEYLAYYLLKSMDL